MTLTGFESAASLVRAIAEGRLSAVELLESTFARIDRHNGAINAVVARNGAMARYHAEEIDRAITRGAGPLGALAGLPFTVKDSIETAGLPTTSGAMSLMRHRPETHAPVVFRLLEAGAILLGKTNLPEYAGDYQTANKVFGVTRNPWDTSRTPGGSSGGSAAAVAAGLSPLDLGSDIAGSIRIPAHFCGVYGHKPSYDIVPGTGHIPPRPGTRARTDSVAIGPFARSAEDLELALKAIAGPDTLNGAGWRLDLPEPRGERLQEIRVAYWFEDFDLPVDRPVLDRLDAAIEAIAMTGPKTLKRAKPQFRFTDVRRVGRTLVQSAVGAGLPPSAYRMLGITARLTALPPVGTLARSRHQAARDLTASHRQWIAADWTRQGIRAQCEEFFKDHDVLLLPVAPIAAPKHDPRHRIDRRTIKINGRRHAAFDLGDWAALASVAYLPATVAPVGRTPDGLPVGIQIVGPYHGDLTTIAMARYLADAMGGFEAPPGFA